MGNERDGAGARDNLEVIRELLRRLEEAALSRTQTISDTPENANRELASLPRRAPPARFAPPSPPRARDFFSSMEVLPVDPVARWRLLIVAIAAYAIGVATTLAGVTYADELGRFATNLVAALRPQLPKKIALAPPQIEVERAEVSQPQEGASAPQPARPSQLPAERTPVPEVRLAPAPEAQKDDADKAGPAKEAVASVDRGTAAAPERLLSEADSASPAKEAKEAVASVDPGSPAVPKRPPSDADRAVAAKDAVGESNKGVPAAQKSPGLSAIALKLAPRVEIRGGQRAAFPVELEPFPRDGQALLLVLRGVPEEMAMSQGSAIGNEIWLMPAHRARDLEFTVAEHLGGTYELSVELVAIDGRMLAQAKTQLAATPAVPGPVPLVASAAQKLDTDTLRRLTARGELLLDTGDIKAARLVLERAAQAGSAVAALRLAETYDPVHLERAGAQGVAGDAAQAVRWYERAEGLGNPLATERLGELRKR